MALCACSERCIDDHTDPGHVLYLPFDLTGEYSGGGYGDREELDVPFQGLRSKFLPRTDDDPCIHY